MKVAVNAAPSTRTPTRTHTGMLMCMSYAPHVCTQVAFNAAPSKGDILDNLRVGFGLPSLYDDLTELVLAQQAVLAAIAKALVDLDLDRSAADG